MDEGAEETVCTGTGKDTVMNTDIYGTMSGITVTMAWTLSTQTWIDTTINDTSIKEAITLWNSGEVSVNPVSSYVLVICYY